MRFGASTIGVASAALALSFGGCGGDDEPSDSGATGAQGASGATGVLGITAEEFLAELLPEKTRAIESVAAATNGCASLAREVEPSLVLVISDAASEADPETPLAELVEAEC